MIEMIAKASRRLWRDRWRHFQDRALPGPLGCDWARTGLFPRVYLAITPREWRYG